MPRSYESEANGPGSNIPTNVKNIIEDHKYKCKKLECPSSCDTPGESYCFLCSSSPICDKFKECVWRN